METNTPAPKIKMTVQYVERFTKDNDSYLKAVVRCADESEEYREDVADFIETGSWGALDEEMNQHLVKYRDRYIQKCLQFGFNPVRGLF